MLENYCVDCDTCRSNRPKAPPGLLNLDVTTPKSPAMPVSTPSVTPTMTPDTSPSRAASTVSTHDLSNFLSSMNIDYAKQMVESKGKADTSPAEALLMIDSAAQKRARKSRFGEERHPDQEAIETLFLFDTLKHGHEHGAHNRRTRGRTVAFQAGEVLKHVNELAVQRLHAENVNRPRDADDDCAEALRLMNELEERHKAVQESHALIAYSARFEHPVSLTATSGSSRTRASLQQRGLQRRVAIESLTVARKTRQERLPKTKSGDHQVAGSDGSFYIFTPAQDTFAATCYVSEHSSHPSLLDSALAMTDPSYSRMSIYRKTLHLNPGAESSPSGRERLIEQDNKHRIHQAQRERSKKSGHSQYHQDLMNGQLTQAENAALVSYLEHAVPGGQQVCRSEASPLDGRATTSSLHSSCQKTNISPATPHKSQATKRFELENSGVVSSGKKTASSKKDSVMTVVPVASTSATSKGDSTSKMSDSMSRKGESSPSKGSTRMSSSYKQSDYPSLRRLEQVQREARALDRHTRVLEYIQDQQMSSQVPSVSYNSQSLLNAGRESSTSTTVVDTSPSNIGAGHTPLMPMFKTHHARYDADGQLNHALFMPDFDFISPSSAHKTSPSSHVASIAELNQSQLNKSVLAQQERLQVQIQAQVTAQMTAQTNAQNAQIAEMHNRMQLQMQQRSQALADVQKEAALAKQGAQIMNLTAELATSQAENARVRAALMLTNAELAELRAGQFPSPSETNQTPGSSLASKIVVQPSRASALHRRSATAPEMVGNAADTARYSGPLLQPTVFEGFEAHNASRAAAGLPRWGASSHIDRDSDLEGKISGSKVVKDELAHTPMTDFFLTNVLGKNNEKYEKSTDGQ